MTTHFALARAHVIQALPYVVEVPEIDDIWDSIRWARVVNLYQKVSIIGGMLPKRADINTYDAMLPMSDWQESISS